VEVDPESELESDVGTSDFHSPADDTWSYVKSLSY